MGRRSRHGLKWEYALKSVTFSPQTRKKTLKINKFYKNPIEELYRRKTVSAEIFAIIVSLNFPFDDTLSYDIYPSHTC